MNPKNKIAIVTRIVTNIIIGVKGPTFYSIIGGVVFLWYFICYNYSIIKKGGVPKNDHEIIWKNTRFL